MERTATTTARIAAERTVREQLGNCPECGHDLPGVAKLIGGRWQLFCTECRICVIGPRDYAVKCWGLKAPTAEPTIDDVRAALQRFTAANGMDKGIALLKNYGARLIGELSALDWMPFIERCNACTSPADLAARVTLIDQRISASRQGETHAIQ